MLQFIEEVESYIRQRNDNINLMPIRCLEEADDMIKDDCKFLNISENNMDFLIMENLYNNPEFIKLFLDKIAINDYTIYQIEHSKKGAYGESDITIIITPSIMKMQQAFSSYDSVSTTMEICSTVFIE